MLTLEASSASPTRFLVSDGQDVSTAELVRRIGRALGRPARLLPVPPALLRAAGRFGDVVERWLELSIPLDTKNVRRLTQSLVLDSGRIRDELGWRAPYDLDTGLRETAVWYRDGYHRDAS